MFIKFILLFLFIIFGGIIAVQDVRSRLISVWAVVLYGISCICFVIYFKNTEIFINNTIQTLIYFSLCLSIILLYYFLKEGRFLNIIDTKIGLGDILIFIAIGITLDLFNLVFFFAFSFFISALIGIRLAKKNKTTPLAGILVCLHLGFLLLTETLNLNAY
jgi:hypothetical protein